MKRGPGKAKVSNPPSPLVVNAYTSYDKIKCLRREQDGTLVATSIPAEYVFFVDASKEDALEGLRGKRRMKQEGNFIRVSCNSYDERDRLCRGFRDDGGIYRPGLIEQGLKVYEADLSPVKRWLIDTGARIQKPRSGYLDLETDSRVPFAQKEKARLLCWGLVIKREGGEIERIGAVLEEDTDACERELIKDLFFELCEVDQVLAWNGDVFDFEYLKSRIEYLGLGIDMRRWLLCDHMLLYQKFNMTASESGDEKASMALNRVAASLKVSGKLKECGVGELEGVAVGGARTWDFWKSGGRNRELLLEYCVEDCATMVRIEDATGYVEILSTLSETCGVFPDSRGMRGKNFVESFVMSIGAKRGMRAPTMYQGEAAASEQFKGAYVFQTKKGLFRDVHVCDFARLYPSIMQAWNMSPETHVGKFGGQEPELSGVAPGVATCPITFEQFKVSGPRGLFAAALDYIVEQRKFWSKKKAALEPGSPEWKEADRRDAAYKIIANTFYGVSGSPFSRYFMRELSESVTQIGAWLIKATAAAAEERGYKLIAGDTDSAMIQGCSVEEFKEFVEWCNTELYPRMIKPWRGDSSFISLAFEKSFSLMINVEKKTYAGRMLHFKGKTATIDTPPSVKGLELKRGDTARLARDLQEEVVKAILLHGKKLPEEYSVTAKDLADIVARWQSYILTATFPFEDAVVAKKIQKTTGGYGGIGPSGQPLTVPAHVRVAKILEARGLPIYPGVKVEYVVADGKSSPQKVLPAMDAKKEDLDLFYLWEQVVWPAAERVLKTCFPDFKWNYYGSVRPLRGVLPGQMGLGFGERKSPKTP